MGMNSVAGLCVTSGMVLGPEEKGDPLGEVVGRGGDNAASGFGLHLSTRVSVSWLLSSEAFGGRVLAWHGCVEAKQKSGWARQ